MASKTFSIKVPGGKVAMKIRREEIGADQYLSVIMREYFEMKGWVAQQRWKVIGEITADLPNKEVHWREAYGAPNDYEFWGTSGTTKSEASAFGKLCEVAILRSVQEIALKSKPKYLS